MTDINVIKNKIKEMKKESKNENIEVKVIANTETHETTNIIEINTTESKVNNKLNIITTPETNNILPKQYKDTYKNNMEHLRVNTIERYKQDIKNHESFIIDYLANKDYYNKKYTNKINEFFSDNNINQENFFELLNKYRNIKMLEKLNIDNIIYNFKKYWITERDIQERINRHYGDYKPIFTTNMLNNIRHYLFNNNYDNDMLILERQNNLLHNYIHFDAGMKRIKAV
jgi:hypothetical protein